MMAAPQLSGFSKLAITPGGGPMAGIPPHIELSEIKFELVAISMAKRNALFLDKLARVSTIVRMKRPGSEKL